jgi:hypothetical protein
VLKLLLLSFVFIASLLANKVIYLSYEEIPQRVVKGEIFHVTIKALSTVRAFEDIQYTFHDQHGLTLLNDTPYREKKGKYFYETFYFSTEDSYAKLPNIQADLVVEDQNISSIQSVENNESNATLHLYPSSFLQGSKLNVITLNPKQNFSNIIANKLELQEYKTTSYDKQHNILVFVANGLNTDITKLHFNNVYKQGIESSNDSFLEPKVTYYVVINKDIENFSFSYFNLLKNSYEKINIPIIVDDDSVVAQSDLKPKDQSKEQLKINIAAAIALVGFFIILWRRKYIYLLFILIPLIYIIYLSIPEKDICIKEGSDIHLLPVENGTIFETTTIQQSFPKEGSVQNFIKVKLKNDKIGWVKNEDICSY